MKRRHSLTAASSVYDRFRHVAGDRPRSVAIRYRADAISYGELCGLVERIASRLQRLGICRTDCVVLVLDSAPVTVATLLAVLKRGAVFVPIDPTYPQERVTFILRDVGAALAIGTRATLDTFAYGTVPTLCIDDIADGDVSQQAAEHNPVAAILYTSGSTGRPRGVIRPQRAITARLLWAEHDDHDVFYHNMSLAVGFSQERLLLPLMLGLPLSVVAPDEYLNPLRFIDRLQRHGVTQLTLTPQSLGHLLEIGSQVTEALHSLRTVAVGGDKLHADLVRGFYDRLPHAQLVNAYGSTESGSAIRGRLSHRVEHEFYLGTAVPGTAVYILDEDMRPCGPEVSGQICVAGASVALGYLNDDERSSERFIRNPRSNAADISLLYLTGDRGCYVNDGGIRFLGRQDRQVKVRGYRIELEEVELALKSHPQVGEVAVIVEEALAGTSRLVAYVVQQGNAPASSGQLREFLSAHLPAYMVPGTFIPMPALPRGLNGKVDVAALPRRERQITPHPSTEDLCELLVNIWREVLQTSDIGIDDDFMALGGDSAMLLHMCLAIEDRVAEGFDVSGALGIRPLTIRALLSLLDSSTRIGEPRSLVARPASSPPTDMPLSFAQETALFQESAASVHAIPHDQARSALILRIDGPLRLQLLSQALSGLLQRHESLRTAFDTEVIAGNMVLGGLEAITSELLMSPLRPKLRFTQRVLPEAKSDIVVHDLSSIPEHMRDARLAQLLDEAHHTRFDYAVAPLVRAVLVRLNANTRILMLIFSHLVADGLSLDLIYRDLLLLYDSLSQHVPARSEPLPIRYSDFASWQRQRENSAVFRKCASYWEQQYRQFSLLNIGALSICKPPPDAPSLASEEHTLLLGESVARMVREASQRHHVTPFCLFLGAYGLLLSHYSGRDRIAIVTFFGGRYRPELRDIVGWFSQPHMIGLVVDLDASLRDYIVAVGKQLADAQAHQDLPTALLRQHLQRVRAGQATVSRMESPPITFEMRRYSDISAPAGLRIQRLPLPARRQSDWGLRVWATEAVGPDAWTLTASYRSDRFARADVQQFLRGFQSVLKVLLVESSTSVSAMLGALGFSRMASTP